MREYPFPLSKGGRLFYRNGYPEIIERIRKYEKTNLATGKKPHPTYNEAAFINGGIFESFERFKIINRTEIDTFFQEGIKNVVELGGPASNLSNDLQQLYPEHIGETLGVTLVDHHFPCPPNHKVLEGDLSIPSGEEESPYDQIVKLMGENKVDLVISRMHNGLLFFPNDPYLLGRIVQFIYQKILSPHGLLLLQVPESVLPFLSAWIDKLKQTEGIDTNYCAYFTDVMNVGYVKIKRNDKAPDELPLLEFTEIKKIYTHIADNTWRDNLQKYVYTPKK